MAKSKGLKEKRAKKYFKMMDKDGNGSLTRDEVLKALFDKIDKD